MKQRMREIVAGLAAAVLLTGCGPVASTGAASPTAPSPTATPSPATTAPPPGAQSLEAQYQQVIANVLPSIVQINTRVGLGSGVVLDTRGHIVTNAHVVGQATQMNVTIATGGAPRRARRVP
ncbi:MAG TPA: signal protein PDZ, partial [Nonomuraea sp.]|nr:signal protein PDZ [Nonomuraea sp.]